MTTKKSETVQFLERMAGGELSFGGLLRAIRLCDELSLEKFANKLSITTSHLCDIEKGRKNVGPLRAMKFARVLGYSREQFVRLALQDLLNMSGIKMRVLIKPA